MNHRKHRKFFFPIGLIALSLLPVIGFQRIAETYQKRTAPLHTMEITWPCSSRNNCNKRFSIEKIIASRYYRSFILSTDSTQNHITLNQARKALNRIKKNRDTVNGVRIIFRNSTKYEDLIKAFDYCMEKFPSTFSPHNNSIWAIYMPVDTSHYPKEKLNEMRRKGHL